MIIHIFVFVFINFYYSYLLLFVFINKMSNLMPPVFAPTPAKTFSSGVAVSPHLNVYVNTFNGNNNPTFVRPL